MTLPLERARSRKPVTWLTLLGVLLLPALIGGMLFAALYNPTERLDAMTAAIVNLDEPVTIEGQYTPLGRQLAAGLVEGADDMDSNLSWVISNESDAASGLADGTYQAVVTIPAGFSAAATSAGQRLSGAAEAPVQAQIVVTTPPDGLVADDLITGQLAAAAAQATGSMLSAATFENVLIGFATLGDQLGEAADGAALWADGANTAADGTATLAGGIRSVSDGAGQLAGGAGGLADGAKGISDGAAALAGGAAETATGLGDWASGARSLAAGTGDLANGLGLMADQVAQLPEVPQQLVDGAHALADNGEQIQAAVSDAATRLADLAASCEADGGSAELCAALAEVSSRTSDALPTITETIRRSDELAVAVEGLAQFGPQLTAALRASADGATQLAGGMSGLADGADDAAGGVRALSGGLAELSTGAATFAGGAGTFAAGAGALADGASDAAAGASDLADGIDELAGGAMTLADGLGQAADALPSLTDEEASSLAAVIADPVTADAGTTSIFGPTAVPLLAAVVLWFGGLAAFIALRSVPADVLTSRRSSVALAWRSLWPAAAIGAGQGVLVAIIAGAIAGYDLLTWWSFAGVAVLAGITFAAVNQALVAVFGGAGRWVSALIGVLAVATGLISTVPGWLAALGTAMPTAQAFSGLIALNGAAVAGLIVWGVLALVTTTLVVALRRTTSAKAVLAGA